jgi:rhamnosyltransferase
MPRAHRGFSKASVVVVIAPKIAAVVVAFHPDLERLQEQFVALLPQVTCVVIVNNGADNEVPIWAKQWPVNQVHCISLGHNMGIAHAQNQGIEWAISADASHILLMDHDSVPAINMVAHLMSELAVLPRAGAVGPFYSDDRRARISSPFIRTVGLRQIKLNCSASSPVLEVDHVIASGCLIPVAVLKHVGLMRADFFIDFVDIEWCLRARSLGYCVYGVCMAHLEHRLGDNPVHFLGCEYLTHSPWRHYFHVRNAMLLYREPWVPLNWKLVSAWRLILKMGFYVVVTAPRSQHFRNIISGFLDGLSGRSGAKPSL